MSFTGGRGGQFRHGALEGSVGSTKTENFLWVLLYMAQMWSSLFPFACFMSHNCAAMKYKLKDWRSVSCTNGGQFKLNPLNLNKTLSTTYRSQFYMHTYPNGQKNVCFNETFVKVMNVKPSCPTTVISSLLFSPEDSRQLFSIGSNPLFFY